MEEIKFYSTSGEFGCFSNFSRHPVRMGKHVYETSEHYYQAQKFKGADDAWMAKVGSAPNPSRAAKMGRSRKHPLRPDWEKVKDGVMYDVLKTKFTQHVDLREILLGTDDAVLIEHTANDSYWADGGDGSGKNMLGKLLMRLRDELKNEAQSASGG